MSDSWPVPKLVATAETVRPDRSLPVRIQVENPTGTVLHGALAELTLEVETGVLLTWRLALADVPAGGQVANAMVSSQPQFELPLNAGEGLGRFRLTLFDAHGAWLNAATLELPVVAA